VLRCLPRGGETDEGVVGWGEAQAPIGTEVVLTIIKEVLGPAILGRDPRETNLRYQDMYETLRVRGQVGGFQMDAIAGLDTALWDIVDRSQGVRNFSAGAGSTGCRAT
jgi:L-alanine-DL-glutamate epimerase-like enolase superfamily enzyme